MQDARFIADCLIHIASKTPENNDITNMKIQKLLYYIQGTHLSLHGKKMFEQNIEKWAYGPVVSDVYQYLKPYGSNTIISEKEIDMSILSDEESKTINMVYEYFGQFSAIKLMNLTHNETPWNSVDMNEVIGEDLLVNFFNTIVIKDE